MKRLVLLLVIATGCSNGGGTPDGGGDAATLAITTSQPESFVPGAAVPLSVVFVQPDGTMVPLPANAQITWSTPTTVVAAPTSTRDASLPSDSPLAIFVSNPLRPDRSDYGGVLFVVQQGNTDKPNVTVTAQVAGYGSVTAYVPIRAALVGDPDAGAASYVAFKCSECHGPSGSGSPRNDAGVYVLQGATYPYPAPRLNAGDGGAAADPGWNGAFFGLAAQADIDNNGVVLRHPMPDLLGSVTAQQVSDIYAYMRTLTQ